MDFTQKKSLRNILNESYHIVSNNQKLILQLTGVGLIPALYISIMMLIFPEVYYYALSASNPELLHFINIAWFEWVLLGIGGFLIMLYSSLAPFSFMKGYIGSREEGTAFNFRAVVQIMLKDAPKALIIFVFLLVAFVLTSPLFFYAYVPLFFVSVGFLALSTPFWKSIKESFVLGTRYWFRSIMGGVTVLLPLTVIMLIFYFPYNLILYARQDAFRSLMEGNEAVLPGYLIFLQCAMYLIYVFVLLWTDFYVSCTMTLHYLNLKARRAEKLALRLSESE